MARITVALDWAVNPNHIGLILAERQRFFAQEGVEVAVLPAERDRGPVEMVLSGAADLGFAFAGTVIEGRARGEALVSVAAVAKHHRSSLATLADRGITRCADLAGRRYASFGHAHLERAVITAMVRHDGATEPHFDLSVTRFADITGLVQGDFDFLWIYDAIEGIDAQSQGIALTLFSPADFGIPNYYAPVIFATDTLLADAARRDAARRALHALRQGYQAATTDPDAALNHLSVETLPTGSWLFATEAATAASMRAFAAGQHADGGAWGEQLLADWQGFAHFLWQHGALGARPEPDYAAYFTNDLLR
jgi:ABC-type nitrate/sulfonate/bicarbonate transport system substrate-binding protein